MQQTWPAIAVLTSLGILGFGARLAAQPPVPATVQVEQFRGLRRVDYVPKQEPPEAKVQPAELKIEQPKSAAKDEGRRNQDEKEDKPSLPPSFVVLNPSPVAPSAPAKTPSVVEQKAESPSKEPVSIPPAREPVESPSETVRAASILVAPLLPMLVILGVLLYLARLLKRQNSPLIRIEHVGGRQDVPLTDLAALLYRQKAASESLPELSAPTERTTAQTFELGPTFQEESSAKKKEAQQREQGVLQQLFDDNLKLRQQLSDSGDLDFEFQQTRPADSEAGEIEDADELAPQSGELVMATT